MFSRVIFVSCLGIPPDMTWEDWFKSQTREEWRAFHTSGGWVVSMCYVAGVHLFIVAVDW